MRVGFIGLGNMGGPMALNMIKAGHTLVVNDIRRSMAEAHLAGGAQWADTPAAVAAKSELVVTSLPGPKEVEAVALGENGILSGMPRGRRLRRPFDQLADGDSTHPRRLQREGHRDA